MNIFGLTFFGEYEYEYIQIKIFRQIQIQISSGILKWANIDTNIIIQTDV